jgi:hypothetical protein
MDETEALAICFANLKGPRDKDYVATAQALEYLRRLPKYGSVPKVAAAVGVSGEIVREFLTILRLPEPIRDLFDQKVLKLEHGRRLAQLGRRRPDLVAEVARMMMDLKAHDARHLVAYVLGHPDLSAEQAQQAIQHQKTVVQREFHVVALLQENEFQELRSEARQRRTDASALVTSIVREWLENRQGADERERRNAPQG